MLSRPPRSSGWSFYPAKMENGRVVLLLSDAGVRAAVGARLRGFGVQVVEARGVLAATEEITRTDVDVLVIDFTVLSRELMEALIEAVRQCSPRTRVVTYAADSEMWHGDVLEIGVFFYAAGLDAERLSEAILAGVRRGERP